jgi:hypothetical protein
VKLASRRTLSISFHGLNKNQGDVNREISAADFVRVSSGIPSGWLGLACIPPEPDAAQVEFNVHGLEHGNRYLIHQYITSTFKVPGEAAPSP